MSKTSHLYLHDKCLKKIPAITGHRRLRGVYLHNNEIVKIENLSYLTSITHLYLQWNAIREIDGLAALKSLKKLYLGNNCISVVENLENLDNLEELHVEKQTLEEGESLCFDPRTLAALRGRLKVLDVSSNQLKTMEWISQLNALQVIRAKNNLLENIHVVADHLSGLYHLKSVDFRDNPMASKHRYRETLTAKCYKLELIDDKSIQENTRMFLKCLEMRRNKITDRSFTKVERACNAEEDYSKAAILSGFDYLEGCPVSKGSTRGLTRRNVVPHGDVSTVIPRCFWRNRTSGERHAKPADELQDIKTTTFKNQPSQQNLQGILKNST